MTGRKAGRHVLNVLKNAMMTNVFLIPFVFVDFSKTARNWLASASFVILRRRSAFTLIQFL